MKASLKVFADRPHGEIDPLIYSSFIEHLGRAVYGGVYEPGHPTADADGFRGDVAEMIKELGVTGCRYPGGNFVSGYHWQDGIGDKSKRPTRLDLAWKALEPNEVGIDEFQGYCKKTGMTLIEAVNLGNGTPEEAQNLVEYCNGKMDSYYVGLRHKNGFEEPFDIRYWCLGNEMDGPWQIGQKTATEYGRLALEAGKRIKDIDPDVKLIVCGSSSTGLRTYGDWEWEVLSHSYPIADYLSVHTYFNKNTEPSRMDFLSDATKLDSVLKGIIAICDGVGEKLHSRKKIMISLDEWNAWSKTDSKTGEPWTVGQHQLEEIYDLADAVLVGSLLSAIQNNCGRVKIACLAQLVNVIAPILTENGGKVWAQTTFYPFALASRLGRGVCLDSAYEGDTFTRKDKLVAPLIQTSVTKNGDDVTVFATNISETEDGEFTLDFSSLGKLTPVEHTELYADSLEAINTKDKSEVLPKTTSIAGKPDDTFTFSLKKHSFNVFTFRA